MRDEDIVEKLNRIVGDRLDERKKLTFKEVLVIVGLIAGTVVTLGGAATYAFNAWSSYGWVTHGEFLEQAKKDGLTFLTRLDYANDTIIRTAHNKLQDDQIAAEHQTGSEILAFVKVVPQLKVLIKLKCEGNRDVGPMIDTLKTQFHDLTKHDYEQPSCSDPEMRAR